MVDEGVTLGSFVGGHAVYGTGDPGHGSPGRQMGMATQPEGTPAGHGERSQVQAHVLRLRRALNNELETLRRAAEGRVYRGPTTLFQKRGRLEVSESPNFPREKTNWCR